MHLLNGITVRQCRETSRVRNIRCYAVRVRIMRLVLVWKSISSFKTYGQAFHDIYSHVKGHSRHRVHEKLIFAKVLVCKQQQQYSSK